ncbi:uncharacterized protein LOC100398547 [Callithrix jacchus]|uniref:glucocorticoid-induced transcript 1 protein n=1 Tax=Callithrix jacchus TaxID=9483 RepID=UPI0023DD535B|nr:glucocorticoid-induced transcript 1 protein [Callithrix jacchus]
MRENLAQLDRAASGGAAGCPVSGSSKVRTAWAAPPERRGFGTGGAAAEPCGPTPPPPRLFANTHSQERSGPGPSRARGYDEATTSRVGRESSAPSIPSTSLRPVTALREAASEPLPASSALPAAQFPPAQGVPRASAGPRRLEPGSPTRESRGREVPWILRRRGVPGLTQPPWRSLEASRPSLRHSREVN